MRGTPEERFWKYVKKTDTCWLWIAHCDRGGYGQLMIADKTATVHRYSYELHFGLIPTGLCVLHKCDIRNCVNPAHLFLGTQADNVADMGNKGRGKYSFGGKNGMAKLTEAEVCQIFDDSENGLLQRQIADKYGVLQPQISQILNKKKWKYLP